MSNDFKKQLGQRIKELRIANNMTQEQLAEFVDMERTNLTRIESGRQFPNAENLEKFTKIFKITPNELFNISHHKSKQELIEEINMHLTHFDIEKVKFLYKCTINLKNI